MLSDEKKPKVGVGVIVLQDGKVLLGKRKNAHGEGSWAFGGGHLEFGETVEECAKRELFEETGLEALSIRPGPWVNDIIEEKHYVTLFMIVDSFVGQVEVKEPDKCEGWEWFEWHSLPLPLFSPIVSLLKKIDIKEIT